MTVIRQLGILVLTYAAVLFDGFLLYIGLVRSPLFGENPVLFYRGICLAAVTAAATLAMGAWATRHSSINLQTLVSACVLSAAFNLTFLIVFPVTFDRSITMFLLARIESQDGKLDAGSLEKVYVREYLGSMRQIDRRIKEQTLSGNIHVDKNGRLLITPQGRSLLVGARAVGTWFGADPRIVEAQSPADAAR